MFEGEVMSNCLFMYLSTFSKVYLFFSVFKCNLFGMLYQCATMNYTNSLWRPSYYSHIKNYMFREVGTSSINNTHTCIAHICWTIFMIKLNRFFLVLKTYLTIK